MKSMAEAADKTQVRINLTLQPCLVLATYIKKHLKKLFITGPLCQRCPYHKNIYRELYFPSAVCLVSMPRSQPSPAQVMDVQSCQSYLSVQSSRQTRFKASRLQRRESEGIWGLRCCMAEGEKAGRQKNWSVVKT